MPKSACFLSEPLERRLARERLQDAPSDSTAVRERLQTLLELLSPFQRELIERHYFEGETLDDIAESLGITHRAAYGKLYTAQKRLRRARAFLSDPREE